jgi:hypothetical protein
LRTNTYSRIIDGKRNKDGDYDLNRILSVDRVFKDT